MQLFVSAFHDRSLQTNRGIGLGLAFPFGPRGAGSAALARDGQGGTFMAQASQADLAPGDLAWRVQRDESLSNGAPPRLQADLAYRGSRARFSAGAEQAAGASGQRFGLQGALVALGGSLHAALPAAGGLAVVEVPGTPGVAVYLENRAVGRTDEDGRLVVSNLLAFQPNRIAIDPLDLPADADVEQLSRIVRPAEHGGVPLRFDVRRSRSALLVLHDAEGRPLPLGATLQHAGSATRHAVGHDGEAYLRQLSDDNEVQVSWGGQTRCTARFRFAALDAASGRIGPVPCL